MAGTGMLAGISTVSRYAKLLTDLVFRIINEYAIAGIDVPVSARP